MAQFQNVPGASQAAFDALNTKFTPVTLFDESSVDTSGATEYALSENYTNYQYVLISCYTANERVWTLVNTDNIASSRYITMNYFTAEGTGLKTSFPYMCYCNVLFSAPNKVKNYCGWTNANVILKVRKIFGLVKK